MLSAFRFEDRFAGLIVTAVKMISPASAMPHNRKRQVIYVRKELSINARYAAAEALIKQAGRASKLMAAKRAVPPADEIDDLADQM
jgi:hypothetical protein